MVRGKQNSQPAAKSEQARLLWAIGGVRNEPTVDDWDCKTDLVVEALLAVVASGATVVLRPGSGGRSVGIAIWEGDERHAPTWCYDSEEVDNWASKVTSMAKARKGEAAD